jgi:hypothetical protein
MDQDILKVSICAMILDFMMQGRSQAREKVLDYILVIVLKTTKDKKNFSLFLYIDIFSLLKQHAGG